MKMVSSARGSDPLCHHCIMLEAPGYGIFWVDDILSITCAMTSPVIKIFVGEGGEENRSSLVSGCTIVKGPMQGWFGYGLSHACVGVCYESWTETHHRHS